MKFAIIAAALAASISSAASAQGSYGPSESIEPYVGLLGGYEMFDRHSEFGTVPGRVAADGGFVEGIAGVNMPLGPVFVGAEGMVAKGTKGDIKWEYGVRGKLGVRAGYGTIFGTVGYTWVKATHGFADHRDMTYGAGVELSPMDMGLGHIFGDHVRFRLMTETYDFDSLRPMMGSVITF